MTRFSTVWAMPSRWTFEIPPISDFLDRWLAGCAVVVDPFSGRSERGTLRNDIAFFGIDADLWCESLLEEWEAKADALLFDLGRVVLDIEFSKAIACWAGHAGLKPDAIVTRYVRDSEAYRLHEVGKISDEDYFQSLRSSLGIGISDAQFLEGWNAIFAGEMPDIAELLPRAARHVPLYAFSNTNRPHVDHFSKEYADLLGHFRELYLSSSIGLRKPDAESFDHVVAAIGVPAERILFFDDSLANIEGAHARGLQAVHVTSPTTVAETLRALGV